MTNLWQGFWYLENWLQFPELTASYTQTEQALVNMGLNKSRKMIIIFVTCVWNIAGYVMFAPPLRKFALKISMTYRNVIKYSSVNKLKHLFNFSTYQTHWSSKTLTVICISSLRICFPCKRTPLETMVILPRLLVELSYLREICIESDMTRQL